MTMTMEATPKQVRNWAMRYDVRLDGKPVGLRGRVDARLVAMYAAADGGVPDLTATIETAPVNTSGTTTEPAVRKPTAAAVAREAALPKLGAGQGRYLSVIKLTDSDIYLTSAGKEWHVMDVDIDGGHVVVQMMNEDQTATVKFSADEMVRVL